jgi:hypothetical protein
MGRAGFDWLMGFCEHDSEPLGSIEKAGCFLTS